MNNENEFLFELTAPFGTTLLTVRNIPHLTASAVRPLLPGEEPHARLPAAELSAAQTQTLYRTMTISEHRKRLYEAIKDGTIEVLHHITYLPLKDLSSPAYVDWQLVSLPDFIRFANTLKIRVLIDAPIDKVQATPVSPVAQKHPAVAADASDGVEPDKVEPVWRLKTSIKRLPGYRWQTYQALQDAHIAGQPCPKAQHLLDTWKLAPPNGLKVIQLPRRDELEYELETGEKKRTTVKQIQAVIQGLLSE